MTPKEKMHRGSVFMRKAIGHEVRHSFFEAKRMIKFELKQVLRF